MTLMDVVYLLAANWHPPCSQSAIETCYESEETSPPAAIWVWEWVLTQCRQRDPSWQAAWPGVAGADGPGAGTGLPGMSSAKRRRESCCEKVAVPVPVPSRTKAGDPSRAGSHGFLVHILRVLRSRERGGTGRRRGCKVHGPVVHTGMPCGQPGPFLRGALAWSLVPCRSPAHLIAERTGKAGAIVFPEVWKFGK